jgi:hypothetical protein
MAKKALITEDGQQKFFETNWFDEQSWLREAEAIKVAQRQIDRDLRTVKRQEEYWADWQGKLNFAIGDWLLAGTEGGIKPRVLKKHVRMRFANDKRYAWGTLGNIKSVCKAVEPSRRRENLSYSMHVEVAPLPKDRQDAVLEYASEEISRGRKFSVRDVKAQIKCGLGLTRAQQMEKLDLQAAINPEDRKRVVTLSLRHKDIKLLEQFGEIKKLESHRASSVLLWMAQQYFAEHKSEVKPFVDALNAKRVSERAEREKKSWYEEAVRAAGQKVFWEAVRAGRTREEGWREQDAAKDNFRATVSIDDFERRIWKGPSTPGPNDIISFDDWFAADAADTEISSVAIA